MQPGWYSDSSANPLAGLLLTNRALVNAESLTHKGTDCSLEDQQKTPCSGLYVCPAKNVQVLTLGTSECDLIWKKKFFADLINLRILR